MFVLDASMALAWVVESQRSDKADEILSASAHQPMAVPRVWFFETHSVLLSLAHNRKITEQQARRASEYLLALECEVDGESDSVLAENIWRVARKGGSSFNDASYLELAQRLDVQIATRDEPVIAAARRLGIRIM